MSLDHKNVVRNNDEFFCTVCGKSWESTDRDPPACEPQFATEPPYNGGFIPPFPNETDDAGEDVDVTIVGQSHVETVTARLTSAGRSEILRTQQFIGAAAAHTLAVHGVSKLIPDGLEIPKEMFDRMKCAGRLRSEDFSRLEELALASVDKGWPTPTSPLCAWLVHDLEDPKTSLLVFAMNGPSAVKYVAAITKKPGTLEARRCRSLDDEAFGASPYCDANPTNRNKAEKAARTRVISLLEWLHGA